MNRFRNPSQVPVNAARYTSPAAASPIATAAPANRFRQPGIPPNPARYAASGGPAMTTMGPADMPVPAAPVAPVAAAPATTLQAAPMAAPAIKRAF